MISLFEILKEEKVIEIYKNNLKIVDERLSKRTRLFNINSPLELDKNLEYMHEAKMSVDLAIKILEYKKIELSIEFNTLKEENKIDVYQIEIGYDSINKQKKEDLTKAEYEKQRDFFCKKKLKEEMDKLNQIENSIKIINFELNTILRIRENIDDVYLSLKKKYESFFKFKV